MLGVNMQCNELGSVCLTKPMAGKTLLESRCDLVVCSILYMLATFTETHLRTSLCDLAYG